jgi:hypothetical protein
MIGRCKSGMHPARVPARFVSGAGVSRSPFFSFFFENKTFRQHPPEIHTPRAETPSFFLFFFL